MKDMKLAFKLLKYSYQVKLNLGATTLVAVAALGILGIHVIWGANSLFITYATYLVLLAATLPAQNLTCYVMTSFSATSPYQKRLQVVMPAMLNFLFMSAGYLVISFVCWSGFYFGKIQEGAASQIVFQTGIFGMIFAVYAATSIKKYLLGTVMFILVVPALLLNRLLIGIPFWTAVLLGEVLILLGAVISRIVCELLYKSGVPRRIEAAWTKKLGC
ncbi:MAG: hypothetical protein K6G30_11540 [Acetatifactor sp.]|nr:hypothetical protein [Acetatifactor sp.]